MTTRLKIVALSCSLVAAFVAGVDLSPGVHEWIPDAHAQGAPAAGVTAAMIDLASIKHADLPTSP